MSIEDEPASPCRRECNLGEEGACTGCGRTLEEISGWNGMSVAEKRRCIADAETRLTYVMDSLF